MMNFNEPKFITFEGGEGSGKTTQSKVLHEYLLSQGIKAIYTREIGGTHAAEQIRDLILHNELMTRTELMLVMAARYEHVNKVIMPALLAGYWVICDRFIDSTACYQLDTDLTIADIFTLHNKLITFNDYNNSAHTPLVQAKYAKGIMPDITFFMDLPPSIALERALIRSDTNKFEAKDFIFHQNVYERFQHIAAIYTNRICTLDILDLSVNEIHDLILNRIKSLSS